MFRECSEVDDDFHGLCDSSQPFTNIFMLFLAATIKFFMTICTFGLHLPAGIFAPMMAIGACVGRGMGIIMHNIHLSKPDSFYFSSCNPNIQCVTPATYAMLGAAAFLSGTTRITISLTVMMFELTGALSYVLPIMITVLCAKWVADLSGKGLYDDMILEKGYPFLDGGDDYIENDAISNIMTPLENVKVILARGMNISEIDEMLNTSPFRGFPVVESHENRTLIGYVLSQDLKNALSKSEFYKKYSM